MKYRNLEALVLVFAILLPWVAMAMTAQHTVDWDFAPYPSFYSDWATSKRFIAGEKIIFSYDPTIHNVQQVSWNDYTTCNGTHAIQEYGTGEDVIVLTKSGTYYFICGFSGHCSQAGMFMKVPVGPGRPSPPELPPPPPNHPPPSSPPPRYPPPPPHHPPPPPHSPPPPPRHPPPPPSPPPPAPLFPPSESPQLAPSPAPANETLTSPSPLPLPPPPSLGLNPKPFIHNNSFQNETMAAGAPANSANETLPSPPPLPIRPLPPPSPVQKFPLIHDLTMVNSAPISEVKASIEAAAPLASDRGAANVLRSTVGMTAVVSGFVSVVVEWFSF